MQVLRTSFSASSLFLLPAATSNPPEVLCNLHDVGRADRTLQDLHESWLAGLSLLGGRDLLSWDTKRPDAPVLWDSTIQLWEQFLTANTGITHFLEAEIAVTGSDDRQDEIDTIPAAYEDRYRLQRPIQVEFEDVAADAVIARFLEAEIAVTGSDRQDAKASLVSWIFDIFDDLADANHQILGRTPALQIRVLNKYISRRA